MIALKCSHCGKGLEVADQEAGRSLACPHCGHPLTTTQNSPLQTIAGPETGSLHNETAAPVPCAPPPASAGRFPFLQPAKAAGEIGWLAHYRVQRLLGEGGMGLVFLAEDTMLLRPVALKVMRPEMAKEDEASKRFLREARTMASVRSDHIVTIHQVGQENGLPFLAMELLSGQPLDEWLDHHRRATVPQVLDIGLQIAKGLAAAHELGMIHRDIKPANIWVEAKSGRIKILDFGLARSTQDDMRLTQTGIVVGTPAYMAPEQADGDTIDGHADLFSLGCVLYELATGQMPFTGSSTVALLKAMALNDPKPVRDVNPDVPAPLANLISQLLAKKPSQRPASAAAVVEALQAIAQGRSDTRDCLQSGASLKPGSSGSRLRKRGLVIGAVVSLVAVAVLGAVFGSRFLSRPGGGDGGANTGEGKKYPPRPVLAQGVTDDAIMLGMTAPFQGPTRELGRSMRLGIETYFNFINDQGGVLRRKLRLVARDDGYDPDEALANMHKLYEQDKVFAIIGNVGTPTAEKTLPYALEKKMLFFGAFTGAKLLRKDPPDRYVFNYRASYEEETAAIVEYLLNVRKLPPVAIGVFAQNDGYGDSGFRGVVKVLRKHGRDQDQILRVGHDRNSTDVEHAIQEIEKHPEIRAVIMVSTYKPAARFINKVKDARPDMIFTNVSFVGSEALAEELRELGPKYPDGVIVTQVVPPVSSQSSAVLQYNQLLQKYSSSESPGFVSLEGYIDAMILVEALKRAGDDLTTDSLIAAFESIQNLDLGIGTLINYGKSEHQGSHKVWATVLDKKAKYQPLELD